MPVSKTIGRATEVTIIAPVKRGFVEHKKEGEVVARELQTYRQRVARVLEDLERRLLAGVPTPVERIGTIHFARWVLWEREEGHSELIFTSNFDGSFRDYMREFSTEIASDLDRVWANCEGYPEAGAVDFDAFWAFAKRYQVKTTAFFAAYPALAPKDVRRLQAFETRFSSFLQEVSGVQRDGAEISAALDRLLEDTRYFDA